MGYTHYWNCRTFDETDENGYREALPIIRKILEEHKDNVKNAEVSEDAIAFDEIRECAETFVFQPGIADFKFCKTYREPYDLAVCKVLLVLNAYMPHLEIRSDGFFHEAEADTQLDGTWDDAVEAVKKYGVKVTITKTEERRLRKRTMVQYEVKASL